MPASHLPPDDLDAIVAALAAVRRELGGVPPEPLGGGVDHRAYAVGDLVVRVSRDAEADLARESALLEVVGRRCAVPVPAPIAVGATWMAYPRLPGTRVLDLELEQRALHAPAVARTVGALLAALWAIPPEDVASLVEDDGTPLEEWRDEAAGIARAVIDELPPAARAGVERFLGAAVPGRARDRVLSHNDLGCEHVLVDPDTSRVTGILDWSDAAIVDPAKDLGLVLRDLGPGALEAALRAAGPSLRALDGVRPRALFYARCLALADLAFGVETGEAVYAESARDAILRLFGGRSA